MYTNVLIKGWRARQWNIGVFHWAKCDVDWLLVLVDGLWVSQPWVAMIVIKARLNTHTGQEFLFYSITINNHHNEPKQRAGKCESWVTLPLSHSSLTLLWFHEVKPAPQGSANLAVPSVANVLALVLISFHKPIDCTKITPTTTGTFLFCYISLYHQLSWSGKY